MLRVRTSCTRDCPDACGIVATVVDGRVTRLEGDPDHPVTRGFLCYRTNKFLQRQYDPRRITRPLFRHGDGFREVSWEAALDRVAQTMLRVREESGAAAILDYRSGGSLGLMKHVTQYFFERFGPVTIKSGDICSGAGDAAQETDFGEEDSHDLSDLLNSRTVVLWGKNPYVSNVHLLPVLREAVAGGCRLVQIDPVHHRGADAVDLYLQPRPGGDRALALGLMRLLFQHGGVDPAAASYCDHLEDVERMAFARTLDDWAALADVPSSGIERLAELYMQGPSAILVGWGLQRRTHGSATVRLLDALAAVSGNVGVPGGGVSFYFKRRAAFDLSFQGGLRTAPRSIPEALLGSGILAAADPPIRMAFVHNGNPVAMLPDSSRVAQALATRELTVVVDAFLTDTAQTAHVVLPTTTMLEDDDLVGAYGHAYLGNVQPVVPPPPGVLTDYEIVRELARRVGLGQEFEGSARDWKRRMLAPLAHRGVALERLERAAVRNPLAPQVLFAGRRFPTASGRVNLIRQVDPEPPRPTAERPMLLTALATAKSQASQWPSDAQRGPASVTVHPSSAGPFADGAEARLETEMGSLDVVVRHDPRQRRDVALMEKGGWFGRGRAANALIPALQTDAGGGAVYYDTPVRLLPREAPGTPPD